MLFHKIKIKIESSTFPLSFPIENCFLNPIIYHHKIIMKIYSVFYEIRLKAYFGL